MRPRFLHGINGIQIILPYADWLQLPAKRSKDGLLLSPVSSRCVYGGVAEVSVYVAKNARGKQIGEQLLRELIAQSEKEGYWTLQSGIFPENTASIGLHKKCGFRKIGFRERIAQLNGVWKDNILMEKRSEKTG